MRRLPTIAVVLGGVAVAVASGVAVVLVFDSGFDRIGRVELLTLPDGPALLVSGARYVSPDSGPSYNEEGWVLLDPVTGETRGRTWFSTDHGFVEAKRVLTASGARVVYSEDDEGLHVRDLVTGDDWSGPELAAKYPDIVAPWYQTRVVEPGVLSVEADDRRWWTLDVRTDRVAPGEERGQAAGPPGRCHTPDWPDRDGRVRTFVQLPTERHSDPNDTALVRGVRVAWDRVDDPVPMGLRLDYAWFLCDRTTGQVATFPRGALLAQWVPPDAVIAISAVGPEGELLWTWSSELKSHPNAEIEVRSFADGFVARVDTRLAFLGPDGEVRWSKDL